MEAIYSRQSLDIKDSLSIDGQIDMCMKHCAEPQNVKVYIDKGYSGKNTNRPQFQQMMEDVKAGLISKIIVYRLDRLSRSILDFANLWEILDNNDVSFMSANENFDTSTPVGRAMIYIIMVFAQLERETISERVRDNYYTRIKTGSWPGGPAPYGFNNHKILIDGRKVSTLEVNENINVVIEIFNMYAADDNTLGSIAKYLNANNIPGPKRNNWDNVALSRILHSPVYVNADQDVYYYYKSKGVSRFSNELAEWTGDTAAHVVGKTNKNRVGNKVYVDMEDWTVSLTNFPGIIQADVWLTVQRKLDSNAQIGNRGKGTHTWLTGLMKCAKCGYSIKITKWTSKSGNETKYLNCSGRSNLHICDMGTFNLKMIDVEKLVEEELKSLLCECGKEPVTQVDDTYILLKKKSEDIKIKIDRLIKSMEEASQTTMKYINVELGRLDKQYNDILKQMEVGKKSKVSYKYDNIIFDELDFDNKKLVAEAFIDKILVSTDDIEIVWKIIEDVT